METWHRNVSEQVKASVNIIAVAKQYVKLIEKEVSLNKAANFGFRQATAKMTTMLKDMGIKNHDACHLLHVAAMEYYPQAYSGCNCHSHLKKEDDYYATRY